MRLAGTEKELSDKAAGFLKAQLKKSRVTYAALAGRLEAQGLHETEASITSKLARGTFAATFFLAVLAALEVDELRLKDL